MGTPEFAVGILDTILRQNFEIVGVITAPDKPAGRGQKIKFSAVKEYALQKGLTLLQPTNLKDPVFLEELRSLNANLQVVVAFRMLPKAVWDMPEYGTFNLHASLLPNYRGAAPINWAIINGETKTGVTTFFIDEQIDTGAMILKSELEIQENETAGELHDRLMKLGSATVGETLKLIEKGNMHTVLQEDHKELKTAYKLNKENCKINWLASGAQIHNLIRGLSPYPGAWCNFRDDDREWQIKIYKAQFEKGIHEEKTGHIQATKKEIKVVVKDGYINLLQLQFPGKKMMSASELLNGIQFSEKAYVY